MFEVVGFECGSNRAKGSTGGTNAQLIPSLLGRYAPCFADAAFPDFFELAELLASHRVHGCSRRMQLRSQASLDNVVEELPCQRPGLFVDAGRMRDAQAVLLRPVPGVPPVSVVVM